MTIKQFAGLCGCNPQTLRYYDRVDLLKPVQVDPWSGYRYYGEEQALDYVTIRDLQAAGFSIEEIRELLGKDQSAVCEAIDAKIAEQENKLREMKTIRQSYRSNMTQIQEKISKVKAYITWTMKQYDAETEFGISSEQYEALTDMMTAALDQALEGAAGMELPEEITMSGAAEMAEEKPSRDFLKDPSWELVYEKHGWRYVKEFLDDISDLENGGEYSLRFSVNGAKGSYGPAFMNTLLGILLARNPDKQKTVSCNAEKSGDGKNHFWLLKRK